MNTRTTSKTVNFKFPFLLKGVDRELAPGDYRVLTDEELIEGGVLSRLPSRFDDDSRPGAVPLTLLYRVGAGRSFGSSGGATA